MRKDIRRARSESDALYAMFFRCSHILHRRMGKRESRQRVLSLLSERGELTQKEIQDHLGIQPGSFSELAARMEQKGFVERDRDETDRRRMRLRLTEAGRQEAESAQPLGDRELFCALSEEERQTLRTLLQKILDDHEAWKRESGVQ